MSIIFDELNENYFDGVDGVNIISKIKEEILNPLTSQMKKAINTLDFYYENIVENSKGEITITYYMSAPKLRGYREKLFSIKVKDLQKYPVVFFNEILKIELSANNKEEIEKLIKDFVSNIETKRAIKALVLENM